MRCYLGIDGGGTKTKLCLANDAGQPLAESIQPTSHYMQTGFDGMTAVLKSGVTAVCAQAGVSKEEIAYAFVGCPGYGEVSADTPRIGAAVAAALTSVPHRVGNDVENALAGALYGRAGINIVAGTGSIGFGKSPSGATMRCGGWHHAIGSDEGSGYWIGLRLLTAFTRQSDGRDGKTALYDAIREELGLLSDYDVIARVVDDWALDRTRIASLAPLAASLYDTGDPCAKRILADAAAELGRIVCTIYHGLHFSGVTQVSYTGGVFRMGERILTPMRAILKPQQMELIPPALPPDRGAVLLAMQQSGAVPDPRVLALLARGL